jgi:exodeoxyribonuclease-3
MKIISWNVNGLRAILNKGLLQEVFKLEPDVICLQEIKTRPDQLSPEQSEVFNGMRAIWNPAKKAGYSGVATFDKGLFTSEELGLGEERFDQEGRLILSHLPEFSLMNIYFPSGQRDYGRVEYKLDFYEAVLKKCSRLRQAGRELVLCGDFNTAHQEIDLRHPRQNRNTSGFLPEERAWVDRYLESGLVDIFRQRYPERAAYTWWTYLANARKNGVGWRLDYFMVTPGLADRVQDVLIYDEVLGSDHCPVGLNF